MEQEMEGLLATFNDSLDFPRLLKAYQDVLRDTETEFLRKSKTLSPEASAKLMSLIQENVFSDPAKLHKDEIKRQIR